MKKILVSLVLIFGLFFSFGNVNVNAQITEKEKQKISQFVNNYFNKLKNKYGKEKTINLFKKLYNKVLNMEKDIEPGDKKELLKMINKSVYNIILKNQDNTQEITKVLGEGIYIKQNKKGFGYTDLYVYGEKISSTETLALTYCDPYKQIFDCYNKDIFLKRKSIYNLDNTKIKEIKNKAFKAFEVTDEGIEDKNSGIKVLIQYGYEGFGSTIIDTKNKKILTNDFLQSISKLKVGKTGIYFFDGGRGPTILYFLPKNGKLIKLFSDDDSENSLTDYELLVNKQIKLIFGNKKIKIIDVK